MRSVLGLAIEPLHTFVLFAHVFVTALRAVGGIVVA
jgi:hypothetical protein